METKRTLEDEFIMNIKKLCSATCQKTLFTQQHLKQHESNHTGDKPQKRIHTNKKPFSCSQCDYKCSRLYNLKKHQRTHTGNAPYVCSLCERKFKLLHHLKQHQKIHTGDHSGTSFLKEIKEEPC